MESESIINLLILVLSLILQDCNLDSLLSFLIFEDQLTFLSLEVDSIESDMILVSELDSFIINSDFTITSILSNNGNLNMWICWRYLNTFSVLEANLTGLIIINNSNSRSSILSNKLLLSVWIVQLHEEILIWLPVIVILNSNVECLGMLTISEINYTLESKIILSSFSITINGRDIDRFSLFRLILNNNCEFS